MFAEFQLLGLESVEKSIHYWENALEVLKSSSDSLPEDDQVPSMSANTISHLEKILEAAYTLQRLSEELFLHEVIFANISYFVIWRIVAPNS